MLTALPWHELRRRLDENGHVWEESRKLAGGDTRHEPGHQAPFARHASPPEPLGDPPSDPLARSNTMSHPSQPGRPGRPSSAAMRVAAAVPGIPPAPGSVASLATLSAGEARLLREAVDRHREVLGERLAGGEDGL